MTEDKGASLRDRAVPSAAMKVAPHYTVAEEPREWAFSPGAGVLRLTQHRWRENEKWWAGDFVDHRGIVSILRQSDYLRLDTVAGNRCHVREWQSYYGDRTVSRLCRALLTDLHGPAQGMETRQGGDGRAPSRSDDSPVGQQADAPNLDPDTPPTSGGHND